ncbi:hypothetical protein B0T20DRAFT_427805 [Sordaria brevicollis]|uniref:BRCT domain-containing protein n=1 Tax=Sordaria brevicollis TaxID=83679 RepID=A0AAE0PLV1_SORBR|nr:hypothetical protein B0T20DRAFT_427805 [Sordaria brevicollis]
MANAVQNNLNRDTDNYYDDDAPDSLDTQAVLDDYMKTYGAGKVAQTNNSRRPPTPPKPSSSSSSKSNQAQHPKMTKPRRTREEDLFPPLTQSEEDRIRNSRPADDLSENKPLDMEAYRAHKARQAAERKRAREEANKPKVSWFKPSQLLVMAAQWEQEAKEKKKKEEEEKKKREAEEKARQASQEKRDKEEQSRAQEAKKAEEQKAETQPSAYSCETTQSNGGRSYEKRIASASQSKTTDALRSSPKLGASSPALDSASVATTVPEPRGSRLLDIPATNKTTSTTQDGSGRVDFGSIARLRNMHSQKQHPSPAHQVPETPVSENNNPFRQSKSQLLGPSQLFGATQFSSAAKAFASPTSSRPSPSDFMHHTVSPNLAVSSPLRARGLRSSPARNVPSSPAALPGAPPPRATQRRLASPGPGALDDDMVIPESPQTQMPRKDKATQRPLATYEPMDKSQERRSSPILASDPPGPPNDEDTDTFMVRRRKAKLKKKAALEQLTEIQFARAARSDDVEIPSSNKSRRGKSKPATKKPAHEEEEAAIPNTVEGSQEQRVESAAAHAIDDESTQSGLDEEPAPKSDGTFHIPRSTQRPAPRSPSPVQEEERPDTSRAGDVPKSSQLPKARGKESAQDPPSSFQLPALPPPSSNVPSSSPPIFERRSRKKRVSASADQAAKIPTSSTVRTTKAGMPSSAVDAAVQTTSDLSRLSSTPVIASSGRPPRDHSTTFTRPDLHSSSPAPVQKLPRDAAARQRKLPKTSSADSLRQSARAQRRLSSSADELSTPGATVPTFDHSVRMSRSSLLKPSAASSMAAPVQRGSKLFEGMAFAISFQSKRTGESADQYNARMDTATSIEKRIKQAGGRILTNGFDELFEPVPVQPASASHKDKSHSSSPSDAPADLLLNSVGSATGFTALIADGHSRKVKYMQALALGLPILASRWVLTCLSSSSIVDWSPYLLAAGQSSFLGDAILSRNLQPYDARTANLVETVAKRGRWLGGSKILLVMSTGGGNKKGSRGQKEREKQEEGKKMAYVFLARVLGAELRRVNSLDEAKRELERAEKEAEAGNGKPYDWVYMDGKAGGADLVTRAAAVAGESDAGKTTQSKKRKRKSVGYVQEPTEAEKQPPAKKIRTLSDELVIQSLILGRMIDEEEFGSI